MVFDAKTQDIVLFGGNNGSAELDDTWVFAGPQVGYDLAGSDGGVFAFPTGQPGFFGSLPGLGIHVDDIVGIVPVNDSSGYDLAGSDGGVFAFPTGQPSGFFGSLPGLGIHATTSSASRPPPTVGGTTWPDRMVGSTVRRRAVRRLAAGAGYSCRRHRQHRAHRRRRGYWLASSSGNVYAFGDADALGSLGGNPTTPIVGMAATNDSGGYWLVSSNGSVHPFGDASNDGPLPAIGVSVSDIVSIVPTSDGDGYWLIGSNGGVFAFGDAPAEGSLPDLGVGVADVIGGGSA